MKILIIILDGIIWNVFGITIKKSFPHPTIFQQKSIKVELFNGGRDMGLKCVTRNKTVQQENVAQKKGEGKNRKERGNRD